MKKTEDTPVSTREWVGERGTVLRLGEVQCGICLEIYPLGSKHTCKASEPAR